MPARRCASPGLSMLQIQDGDGTIISSGHFRNEHGRVEAGLAPALTSARGPAFVTARSAEREFLALARVQSFQIGGRAFTIVGGIAVDESFLARLARDRAIVVSLDSSAADGWRLSGQPSSSPSPGNAGDTDDAAVGELQFPLIRTGAGTRLEVVQARLKVTQSLTPLQSASAQRGLLVAPDRRGDRVPRVAAGRVGLVANQQTAGRACRQDGRARSRSARRRLRFRHRRSRHLVRLLGDLAARLRTSTARVREAERRATVGDLARQINHDIKNGLIPLRNVMRHLAQVERDEPAPFRWCSPSGGRQSIRASRISRRSPRVISGCRGRWTGAHAI